MKLKFILLKYRKENYAASDFLFQIRIREKQNLRKLSQQIQKYYEKL
jgi:hypothetical protein